MMKVKRRTKMILIWVFLAVVTITSISAWYDRSQHKTSNFNSAYEQQMVVLDNSVRDTLNMLPGAVFELYKIEESGPVRIGDQYTTNEDGEVILFLSEGNYYFKPINPPFGYEFEITDNFEFEVIKNTVDIVLVPTYSIRKDNTLILNNLVENSDGSALSDSQRQVLFDYVITFSDGNTYEFTYNNSSEVGVIENGHGTVSLTHLQSIMFENIPYGVDYLIEVVPKEDYIPSHTQIEGTLTHPVEFTVTHVYIVPTAQGSFAIMKYVENQDGSPLTAEQLAMSFEFLIEFEDSGRYPATLNGDKTFLITSGSTVELKHGDYLSVENIPQELKYTITEKDYSDIGYTSSHQVIQGSVSEDYLMLHQIFNTYLNGDDGIGTLALTKEVFPSNTEEVFEFTVVFGDYAGEIYYRVDQGDFNIFVNGSTIQLKQGQNFSFYNIPYGTTYTITETDHPDYIELMREVTGTINKERESILFKNVHLNPEILSYLDITKFVVNGDMDKAFEFTLTLDGEVHTFALKNGESKRFLVEVGSVYEVTEKDYLNEGYSLTMTNGKGTIISEGTVYVEAVNTYDQALVKDIIKGEVVWIVPDDSLHVIPDQIEVCVYNSDNVKVMCVTTDESKDWKYEFELPKYDLNGNEIKYTVKVADRVNFEIDYDETVRVELTYIKPAQLEIEVIKEIDTNSNNPPDETFVFTITAGKGAPLQKKDNVLIDGAGVAKFKAITFTAPGIYQYTIRELSDTNSKYKYDAHEVIVTVTVVRIENEHIIDRVVYTKNGKDVDSVYFINTYTEIVVPDPEPDPKPPISPGPDGGDSGSKDPVELPATGLDNSYRMEMGFLLLVMGMCLWFIALVLSYSEELSTEHSKVNQMLGDINALNKKIK